MRRTALLLLLSLLAGNGATAEKAFRPGELWPDNNGVAINCHGGGMLVHGGTFYWFGQHMIEGDAGNYAQVGVHVYSSKTSTTGRTKESPCGYPTTPRATSPRAASWNGPK